MQQNLSDEIMTLMQTGRAKEAARLLRFAPVFERLRRHKKQAAYHLASDDLWARLQHDQMRNLRAQALRRMLDMDTIRLDMEMRIYNGLLERTDLDQFLTAVTVFERHFATMSPFWEEQNAVLRNMMIEELKVEKPDAVEDTVTQE